MTLTKRPLVLLCAALVAATGAVPALAADGTRVELTPFFGQRVGGEFVDDFGDIFFDIEVDDGSSAGLMLGFDLSHHWQLELMWSHQETELVEDTFLLPELPLFDLDVDYYHVGMLYQWKPGQVQPFIVGSLGATTFGPAPSDLSDETRFSVSLGGGIKVMFGEHVGLRLEARGFSTLVSSGDDAFCDDPFYGCRRYDDEYFFQGEARAGLVFAF